VLATSDLRLGERAGFLGLETRRQCWRPRICY
jgi:hypothetical protein